MSKNKFGATIEIAFIKRCTNKVGMNRPVKHRSDFDFFWIQSILQSFALTLQKEGWRWLLRH